MTVSPMRKVFVFDMVLIMERGTHHSGTAHRQVPAQP